MQCFESSALFSENTNIYVGKESVLPSGYGFPMIKGWPHQKAVNKM